MALAIEAIVSPGKITGDFPGMLKIPEGTFPFQDKVVIVGGIEIPGAIADSNQLELKVIELEVVYRGISSYPNAE
jgi:hypothetical protein